MCQKYNGYENYETWCISLWIDNEQGSQEYWSEQAQEIYDNAKADQYSSKMDAACYTLSKELKSWAEENNPIKGSGMYSDLLQSAIDNANYYEIASNMLEEVDKEADSESIEEGL
jgi:hypothetical protein